MPLLMSEPGYLCLLGTPSHLQPDADMDVPPSNRRADRPRSNHFEPSLSDHLSQRLLVGDASADKLPAIAVRASVNCSIWRAQPWSDPPNPLRRWGIKRRAWELIEKLR